MTGESVFSDQLERWLGGNGSKSLGSLSEVFAEKGFAVTILLLMFTPALPLPTGGFSHVFEAMTVALAVQMVLRPHTLWLPERLRSRELGAMTTRKAIPFIVRRVRWLERFSRPRWSKLFEKRWFLRILGLVLVGFAVTAGIAPPFSGLDTLPALGAVLVALSIILEDVVILGVGILIGTGGLVLILTIGATLVRIVRHLL